MTILQGGRLAMAVETEKRRQALLCDDPALAGLGLVDLNSLVEGELVRERHVHSLPAPLFLEDLE